MRRAVFLLLVLLTASCGPKRLHVTDPHCHTDPDSQVTLCINR